ncbi:hypothetical protein T02_6129 [Trichinella nativa]|uniref:Uncharacterized protein n=1 Tax=Trichinella nativa TaxID=6335 RepID=A0A0V1LKI1_9BILA|nr:hypothetical protein T02_6129 [Trichinella nativa]
MESIISKDGYQDDGRIRYMLNLITSSPELSWSFICSGHRDKSCSYHFVLNAASVSIEFVPDCSCIIHTDFIHYSITLTSSEYDISSDGALVPLATLVHMDIKAFSSRTSLPLLITNSYRGNSILFMKEMKYP